MKRFMNVKSQKELFNKSLRYFNVEVSIFTPLKLNTRDNF